MHKVAKHSELINLREDVNHYEEDNTDDIVEGAGMYLVTGVHVAIDMSWLERHLAYKHNTSCSLCDFDARSPSLLKEHQQAIHEGIRYPL